MLPIDPDRNGYIVRCGNCARIWTGHVGEQCPFCGPHSPRVAWGTVVWVLTLVGLVVAVAVML